MSSVSQTLAVSKEDISTKVAGVRRLARVAEAISWNPGTQAEPIYHTIWQSGEYTIALAKPGKEAAPGYNLCKYQDGHKGNNPNDTRPTIFQNGVRIDTHVASFYDIFDELQNLGRADESALELIGCLLFRSAYMVDHGEVTSGIWRYRIPANVLTEITTKLPIADGLPMEVFLHFLDALAWNEDTKYHTLGFDVRLGYGRRNNLLTCVNLIGVLLRKVSLSKFAGNFSRMPAGISAISNKEALEVFPHLKPTS